MQIIERNSHISDVKIPNNDENIHRSDTIRNSNPYIYQNNIPMNGLVFSQPMFTYNQLPIIE